MVNKWELIGYVHASKYRKIILEKLIEGQKTPRELERFTKINLAHISRALKELSNKNLVKCLNPDAMKSKFYSITKLGQEIIKKVK